MSGSSWLLGMSGYCLDCPAANSANNAVGWAAQHHQRTGHRVRVEVTRCIGFGALQPGGQDNDEDSTGD